MKVRALHGAFVVMSAVALLVAVPAAAKGKSRKPYPAGSPAAWFTNKDYPAAARRAREQGRVAIELGIGADGRVTDCRVKESSGSATLDGATCDLVRRRGTFNPALDKDGNPVAGTYLISTRWALEDDDLRPRIDQPWHVVSVVAIDAEGKPGTCRQEASIPANSWTPFPCSTVGVLPVNYGLFTRTGITGSAPVEVTFEAGLTTEAGAAAPMVYNQPKRTVLSLAVMRLDVDANGKVTGCKVVTDSGTNLIANLCQLVTGGFAPTGKPGTIIFTRAISRAGG